MNKGKLEKIIMAINSKIPAVIDFNKVEKTRLTVDELLNLDNFEKITSCPVALYKQMIDEKVINWNMMDRTIESYLLSKSL